MLLYSPSALESTYVVQDGLSLPSARITNRCVLTHPATTSVLTRRIFLYPELRLSYFGKDQKGMFAPVKTQNTNLLS